MVHPRKFSAMLLALALLALVAAPAVTAPGPEPKAVSEDDSKWLLPNAEVILKFNIKQMLASDLMKKGGIDMLQQAIKSDAKFKGVLDAAGLDITKDVDVLLASGAGTSPTDAKGRIVITGRFNPEKVETAMKKHEGIKFSKEGTTNLYEVPLQDQIMFAAFANKNTLVLTHNKESTLDVVKNGGKAAAPMSKELRKALGSFTGKESVSFVMVVNDDLKKAIAMAPRVGEAAAKLQTVTAAITMTGEVDLAVRGITGDAKAAGQLRALLDTFKAAAGLAGDDVPKAALDVVEAIKISADKDSVKIDLKVTKEMIEKATKGG